MFFLTVFVFLKCYLWFLSNKVKFFTQRSPKVLPYSYFRKDKTYQLDRSEVEHPLRVPEAISSILGRVLPMTYKMVPVQSNDSYLSITGAKSTSLFSDTTITTDSIWNKVL